MYGVGLQGLRGLPLAVGTAPSNFRVNMKKASSDSWQMSGLTTREPEQSWLLEVAISRNVSTAMNLQSSAEHEFEVGQVGVLRRKVRK